MQSMIREIIKGLNMLVIIHLLGSVERYCGMEKVVFKVDHAISICTGLIYSFNWYVAVEKLYCTGCSKVLSISVRNIDLVRLEDQVRYGLKRLTRMLVIV